MYISINTIASESQILERDLSFFSLKKMMIRLLDSVFHKITHRLIADLDRSLLALHGAFAVIESYTPEQAKFELSVAKKVILTFKRANIRMMGVNYFDIVEIESKVKECISLLEDIDIQLRRKVHAMNNHEGTSDELLSALAKQSMSALSQSLSK